MSIDPIYSFFTGVIFVCILGFINRIWEMRLVANNGEYVPSLVRAIYTRHKKVYKTYKRYSPYHVTSGHIWIGVPYLVNILLTPVFIAVIIYSFKDKNLILVCLLMLWPAISWIVQMVRVVIPAVVQPRYRKA